ncbi:alpha/beta hydrolase [Oleiharenicola lentus]|uniref:alpha/beta hydrolase n=1 Tax=Oleiharenicola lentus TaxID=2508720 RepID=UPI003F671A81
MIFPRLAQIGLLLVSFFWGNLWASEEVRVVNLWPEGVPDLRADAAPEVVRGSIISNIHIPSMMVFPAPAGKATGTAVIICPGGGYVSLWIENEGRKVAEWLNSIGVTAFVLKYRLREYGHPAPLRDVLRAVRTIRADPRAFGISSDRIGVLGASAGGHLAASAGTLFESSDGKTGDAFDAISARPDFLVLLYPVITLKGAFAHAGSREALLGSKLNDRLIEELSLETKITKLTPPTFITATEMDKTVPVENSLMFFQSLRSAGVPAELHVYEKGPHGFGMQKDLGTVSSWTGRCEDWLRANGWLTRAN